MENPISDEGRTDLKFSFYLIHYSQHLLCYRQPSSHFTVHSSLSRCNMLLSTQIRLSARLCSLALYDICPHLPSSSIVISRDLLSRLKVNPWPSPLSNSGTIFDSCHTRRKQWLTSRSRKKPFRFQYYVDPSEVFTAF